MTQTSLARVRSSFPRPAQIRNQVQFHSRLIVDRVWHETQGPAQLRGLYTHHFSTSASLVERIVGDEWIVALFQKHLAHLKHTKKEKKKKRWDIRFWSDPYNNSGCIV